VGGEVSTDERTDAGAPVRSVVYLDGLVTALQEVVQYGRAGHRRDNRVPLREVAVRLGGVVTKRSGRRQEQGERQGQGTLEFLYRSHAVTVAVPGTAGPQRA
jgi:hypothetical protein